MENLKGACIIGQSGGPTAVINASAQGVIQTALASPQITRVLGAAHGIKGVLADQLYDMGQEDPGQLELLQFTPSSALGSCRYKLADPDVDDTDYKRILEIFQKYDVRYFFYNGGNDSMDTCNKISKYMQRVGYPCNIIGVPKTIDNDLSGTDHCPGYASAAKYIATSCMAFLADVKRVYEDTGNCLVAVSECIHYGDGTFVSEAKTSATDGFGHAQLGGLAALLAESVKRALGVKVRGIELSLLQRCGSHLASLTDVREAYLAGKAAVEAATAGLTDQMVALDCTRDASGYHCQTKLIPLTQAANTERKVPLDWITPEGNGVRQPFIDYALPLIQGELQRPLAHGLPQFAHLKKVRTTDMD